MDPLWEKKPSLRTLIILFLINFLNINLFGQDRNYKNREIIHAVYITSNTGSGLNTDILQVISGQARKEKSVSLLLMGNITGEEGFLMNSQKHESVRSFLQKDLLKPLESFNGKIFFVPGVNEWNSKAPGSIEKLEDYLQNKNNNLQVLPDDGCAIESESLNDQIELVSVDSQWFLSNWDDHPGINAECDYKTREAFFMEFKDELKDNQGKTVIVAVNHPVMSNQLIPFHKRILGVSPAHFESKQQKELRGRLETLASQFKDVIFVSGNHRNLQFLHNNRNPQVISGAAGPTESVNLKGDGIFASEKKGYAKISFFSNMSWLIQFFSLEGGELELIFEHMVPRERPDFEDLEIEYPRKLKENMVTSIYSAEETEKSDFYEWLWGDRYRETYSLPIEVPVLIIDSLGGNPTPIAEGGGQQSRSLRLINDSENEYTLRAMRKDPIRYLQADVVKNRFIGDFLNNTIAESIVSDFFTSAHPYAPFAVDDLSEALNIHHTKPQLYYVPKQESLGIYNKDYGNELYMLEAHVGEENKDFENFGAPDNIISTADLLLELRESKKSYVDQDAYLRARIFDMLIGDWDRHQDQWRWALFNENGKKRYEPIPRDRDHAFSRYDGFLFPLLQLAVPLLRKMQSYDEQIDSVKWFNLTGYPLDQRFITGANWEDWKKQVEIIQKKVTDKIIDEAFQNLPQDVIRTSDISLIKENLKKRREDLLPLIRRYYEYLQEFQTITGTNMNDFIVITRKEDGITQIRITSENQELFSENFSAEETDEIWLYGLDGEDIFELEGSSTDLIELKLIGGRDKDTYNFKNPKKAKIYDYKSDKSIIMNPSSRKWLVDSYSINEFHYTKRKYTVNRILPVVDYVSDAGLTFGVKDIYTTYGLAQNPFTEQYVLSAQYFFTSNGFQINASAEFAHIFYNWNFRLKGLYSSPNYFINYFGAGNTTEYNKDAVNKQYNQVKLEQWEFRPSVIWHSDSGAFFSAGPVLQSIRVPYVESSYLADILSPENDIFDTQLYAGAEVDYNYKNKNNASYPSLGSNFELVAGYKQSIHGNNNQFGFLRTSFSFDYPLVPNGFAVFATKIGGDAIIGNEYEFYHGATIGGNNSLRGYRNHRFNGKYSFYHSTDIRTALGIIRTNFVPLIMGVTAGFDYGRVWLENEYSHKWHNNYGGSFWINGFYALTANVGFYHGGDGNRITLTINFKY